MPQALKVPDFLRAEIIRGEIVVSPRTSAYDDLARHLGARLLNYGQDRDQERWRILGDVEIHLETDIVQPSLAGWRRSRLPDPPAARERIVAVAPDWACEVLSPLTAANNRKLKLPLFARAQVAHVWLIDPRARTLEVLRRQEDRWLLWATFAGEDRVRAEPFNARELHLEVLWAAFKEPCGRFGEGWAVCDRDDAVERSKSGCCAHARSAWP